MKRIFILLIAVLILAGCIKDYTIPKIISQDKIVDYDEFTFDNKMTLLLKEDHSEDKVVINIAIKLSPNDDILQGTNSLLYNTIATGTKYRDMQTMMNEITDIGAVPTSWDSGEYFMIGISSDSKNFGKASEILLDVIKNANFPKNMFNVIKQDMILSIQSKYDNPENKLSDEFNQVIYGDTNFGYILQEEDIEKITRKEVIEQYNDFFVPSNMIIAITGNIDKSVIISNVAELMKDMPRDKEITPEEIEFKESTEIVERMINDEGVESPKIMMGYMTNVGYKNTSEALRLKFIKEYINNKLMDELREKREGLAYAPHAYLDFFNKNTALIIEAQTTPGNLELVKNITMNIIKGLKNTTLTTAEMDAIKTFAKASIRISDETFEDQNSDIIDKIVKKHYLSKDEEIEIINSVNNDDVQSTANKYLKNPIIVSLDR